MLPKLKISAFLLKRLESVKQQCSGCLFGVFYGNGTLLLMGFNLESTIGQLNYEQIQYKFPAELDLCGLVKFGDCTDAEAHLSEIFKDVEISDNPILLHCELGTLVGMRASIFMHEKLVEIPYEVIDEEELYRDFCFTRLRCSMPLYTESNVQSVRHEMQLLRKSLSGGSLAFHVEPTTMYITTASAHGCEITNDCHIDDVIDAIGRTINGKSQKTDITPTKSNKVGSSDVSSKKQAINFQLSKVYGAENCSYDVIDINVLRSKTRERTPPDGVNGLVGVDNGGDGGSVDGGGLALNSLGRNTSNNSSTMSMCVQREDRKMCVPLSIDAMAILHKQTKVNRLYDILIESLCRSLRLFEQSMIERLEETDGKDIMMPLSYHFYPEGFGHFLSCSYLDGVPDDDPNMQDKRKRLHRHFGLPVIRPYFRRSNRCVFHCDDNDYDIRHVAEHTNNKDRATSASPLRNTHIGVRASGVTDGKQYFVHGIYSYYHYQQQQMNDKGWGCAYRSLQTLCSWFQHQGYTERSVPTHKEIQEYLVRIGDKPKNFVGSSQWIGSTEVSMCLQGFLNVDSQIQHVANGGDMVSVAIDLAQHFQTHGTPIMIGGGVLAHTIIGIDYCVQSGECKFLILDPHYTGADDLHVIQSKGWCGWKGADFWDKKSYYNLCKPQRPLMF